MCVKFSLENLNPGPYIPHPTSTCTCEIIIVLRVRNGEE